MTGEALSRARIGLKRVLKQVLSLPGLLLAPRRPGLRVLFYHRVNPYPFAALGPVSREITVRPEEFAWQMRHLARRGFRVLGLDEFERIAAGEAAAPEKSVLLTFDDGFEDNLLFAAPVLAEHGFPAVVFVVSDFLGSSSAAVWPHAEAAAFGRFLGEAQARQLDEAGIRIASHTATHPPLTGLDAEPLRAELEGSRRRLEALLGRPVRALAYPGGDFDGRVEAAARAAGYRLGFTTRTGALGAGWNSLALRRTEVSASDSRFLFRMKLAGALDWLAVKDGAFLRGLIGAANRLLLPLARAR